MIKPILSGLLVATILLTLAACGDGTSSSDPSNSFSAGDVSQEIDTTGLTLPDFSTSDLGGNTVTHDLFADYTITMVNIWGTFCGPCVNEMPDLGALGKDMPEGTQLIGYIVDAIDPEVESLARRIMDEADADFLNLLPEDNLARFVGQYPYVPTTIFVDSQGNLVGEELIGSRSAEEYLRELTARLDLVEE